ncbi:hypothetical protein L3N51_00010 [Metallosphaera sp. J1]|nr:hypothetical protein [Metallosphaera javensis (ex Hofmann et al. 2022)]
MFQELAHLKRGQGHGRLHLYFLSEHRVVSPVNPNESLRDRLVRFKRATRVNRSFEMMRYSVGLVLWKRGLMPEFITL